MAEKPSLEGNPRWMNYCRLNSRTSDEQLAYDRKTWPGGPMIGYTQWNDRMIGRFYQNNQDAFCPSGNGVAMTEEGHARYDAWLTERVSNELEFRQERMKADADMIRMTEFWPVKLLRLKTQPWVTEAAGGQMRFGHMYRSDLLTVHQDSPVSAQTYGSIEDLVKTWSVD